VAEPVVSVVITAHDAAETLGRTLEAIARQRLAQDFEVVVVDNGSSDGTAEVVEKASLEVVLVRQEDRGISGGRNSGIEAARAPVVAFTDSDCFPTSGWLDEGLRALDGVDILQGPVHPDPAAPFRPFDRSLWIYGETGRFETANLFVRREVLDRVGGFEDCIEPEIGKAFGEDIWFGWRARRAGARSAFCPNALVHHAVFPRGARAFVAERRRYRYFAAVCALVPELRGHFFARYFLNDRTARFDAALVGCVLALAARRRLPLLLAIPYAYWSARHSLAWGRRAPQVAGVGLVADVVGFASLVRGSVRWRSLVL
jgi:glycosyltransferase involved in cell wall biosynthesis